MVVSHNSGKELIGEKIKKILEIKQPFTHTL